MEKFVGHLKNVEEISSDINENFSQMRKLSKVQLSRGLKVEGIAQYNVLLSDVIRNMDSIEKIRRTARRGLTKDKKQYEKEYGGRKLVGEEKQMANIKKLGLAAQEKSINGMNNELNEQRMILKNMEMLWKRAGFVAAKYNKTVEEGSRIADTSRDKVGKGRSGRSSKLADIIFSRFSHRKSGIGGIIGLAGKLRGIAGISPLLAEAVGVGSFLKKGFDFRKEVEMRGAPLRQRGFDVYGGVGAARSGLVGAQESLGMAEAFMRTGGRMTQGRMTNISRMGRGFGLDATQLAEQIGSMAGAQGMRDRGQSQLPNAIGKMFGSELNKWGADMPMILDNMSSVVGDLNGTLSSVSESSQVALMGFQKALLQQGVSTKAVPQLISNALQSIINPQNNLMKTVQLMASGFVQGEEGILSVIDSLTNKVGGFDEKTSNELKNLVREQKGFTPALMEIGGLMAEKAPMVMAQESLKVLRELLPDVPDFTIVTTMFGNMSRESAIKMVEALDNGLDKVFSDLLEKQTKDTESPIDKEFNKFKGTIAGNITKFGLMGEQVKLLAGAGGFKALSLVVGGTTTMFEKLNEAGDKFVGFLQKFGILESEKRYTGPEKIQTTPEKGTWDSIKGGVKGFIDNKMGTSTLTPHQKDVKIGEKEYQIKQHNAEIQRLKEKLKKDSEVGSEVYQKVRGQFQAQGIGSPRHEIRSLENKIRSLESGIEKLKEPYKKSSWDIEMQKKADMEKVSGGKEKDITATFNINIGGDITEDTLAQIEESVATGLYRLRGNSKGLA